MNPVHRVSFFFLHRKTPKYQLGSFTVHFSAMRTHAPSLVGGSAAVSASCLSQNVRPECFPSVFLYLVLWTLTLIGGKVKTVLAEDGSSVEVV